MIGPLLAWIQKLATSPHLFSRQNRQIQLNSIDYSCQEKELVNVKHEQVGNARHTYIITTLPDRKMIRAHCGNFTNERHCSLQYCPFSEPFCANSLSDELNYI